jgi:hypothetical protein
MTTAHDIDWPAVLADRITTTSADVLREMPSTFIHTLMGAEADALCGAGTASAAISATGIVAATGSLELAILSASRKSSGIGSQLEH